MRMPEQGPYEVDPRLVADAILARILDRRVVLGRVDSQKECSKPESPPLASVNTASG
jgi:hypothetical protein